MTSRPAKPTKFLWVRITRNGKERKEILIFLSSEEPVTLATASHDYAIIFLFLFLPKATVANNFPCNLLSVSNKTAG